MRNLIKTFFVLTFVILYTTSSFGDKKALLIGVGDYKNLKRKAPNELQDLKGPPNDVNLLKRILVSKYGFADPEKSDKDEIRILRDSEALRKAPL